AADLTSDAVAAAPTTEGEAAPAATVDLSALQTLSPSEQAPASADLTKLAEQAALANQTAKTTDKPVVADAKAATDAAQPAAASLGDEIASLTAVQTAAEDVAPAATDAQAVETTEVAASAALTQAAKPAETAPVAPQAGKTEVAAKGEAVVTARAVAADQAAQDAATNSDSDKSGADAFAKMATDTTPTDAPAAKIDATFTPTVQTQAAQTAQAPAETIVRGSPETVAALSAEISKKLDAKSTRFDIVLTPEGLGKVDVQVRIGAEGKLTATLAFDNPQAAADLRHRAGELRQALSQAGFDVADNALKFDVSSQGGNSGQGQQQNAFFDFQGGDHGRRAFAGRAFAGAAIEDIPTVSASSLIPGYRGAETSGVDVKI
ncbi:flagellar hook-length control protein FliK, partial [Caulobacter sp. D5]|uniref:flagellar hook-length control protein FliK n=2 Tax=unclassified Caulobacter TaxID=2648921 RepID=UPI001E2F156E